MARNPLANGRQLACLYLLCLTLAHGGVIVKRQTMTTQYTTAMPEAELEEEETATTTVPAVNDTKDVPATSIARAADGKEIAYAFDGSELRQLRQNDRFEELPTGEEEVLLPEQLNKQPEVLRDESDTVAPTASSESEEVETETVATTVAAASMDATTGNASETLPLVDDVAEEQLTELPQVTASARSTTAAPVTIITTITSADATVASTDNDSTEEVEPLAATTNAVVLPALINEISETTEMASAVDGAVQPPAAAEEQEQAPEAPRPTIQPEVETLQPLTDNGDRAEYRFDLSRYTAPSNYSEGGISLNETSAERDAFFAERESLTTEQQDEASETTTDAGIIVEREMAATEDADQLQTTFSPEALTESNYSVESNRSQHLEQSQIETTNYDVGSNEVRNETLPVSGTGQRGKKGKFLDQFNEETTEDNDINLANGAAWALAGMKMVERKQTTVGQAASESVEIVRDDSENVVANNTLKQLMDWASIVQDADFAKSSFNQPAREEPKDRRTYANKVPTVNDGLSEENRLTAVVTEMAPVESATELEEENVVDTTFASLATSEKPRTSEGDLDDFKFEERSTAAPVQRRPDLINFITNTPPVRTTSVRSYEVSENVDETETSVALAQRTTTPRYESSTAVIEDVPITTYSPPAPILRRTETTTPIVATTTEYIRPTRRFRPVTTTTEAPTTQARVEDTSIPTFAATTEFVPAIRVRPVYTSSTTETIDDPLINELSVKPVDQNPTDSAEVNLTVFKDTDEANIQRVSTTTDAPLQRTTSKSPVDTDKFIIQQSTVVPSVVVFRPFSSMTTTSRVDLTRTTPQTPDEPSDAKLPVVIDEKNLYDTVLTTSQQITTASSQDSSSRQSTSDELLTTHRTIDRAMTTTELSEEESVTEEDYIELNASMGRVPSSNVPTDSEQSNGSEQQLEDSAETTDNTVVIAVVASIVSVIVVLLLIAAFIVFRKRQNQVSYGQRCRPVGLDAYSLDNVSVYNSVRRKGNTMRMSKRSYGNSAFEDPGLKTNPLTVAELANIIQNKTAIYDEFKEIPNVTARADEVPEGCEDKNRYANVVPLPETRVHLKRINDDEKTEYINANFVKGPKDSANYYIACQAPMENTINDFWRMIWEQSSKVIIMATDLSENGVEKCAEYLPPSVVLDNSRTFGDFQLTLKNRENKEKFTVSTVHLRNTQTNTWREIMHFWYQWPDTGVPIDESSIIAMLLEARTYLKLSPTELADNAAGAEVEETVKPTANGATTAPADANAEAIQNNNNNTATNNTTTNTSSNNNATTGAVASKESSTVLTNGGNNTMDKHKSLQRTQGPLSIHCSPGTGRTGTIVACDIALRVLEVPPRTVDIPHIVYYVRRGRASAVRTREQYELIYRVANVYATKLTGPTIET